MTLPEPVAGIEADDAALLDAFVKYRSEAAFRLLVDRHANLVYGAALRRLRGDSHLAKDVCQRVFVDLARKAPTLRVRRDLCGWLYTSTRYAASHVLRTEQRRRLREEAAAAMNETASAQPHDPFAEVGPALDEALDSLSSPDRDAVLRRFFRNESFAQIAAALAMNEDAARMKVKRALVKLEAALVRRGVVSAAAGFIATKGLAAGDGSLAGAFISQQAQAVMAPAGLAGELSQASYQGVGPGIGAKPLAAKLAIGGGALAVLAGAVLGIGYHQRSQAEAVERARLAASTAALAAQLSETRSQLAGARETLKQRTEHNRWLDTFEHSQFALRLRPLEVARYAALWRELHLDPERQAKAQRLILDRGLEEVAVLHNLEAGAFPGLSATDPRARETLTRAVDASVDIALKTVLGDSDFARFQTYAATVALRSDVEAASARVGAQGTPLTDSEIDQVTAALAAPQPDSAGLSPAQKEVYADTLARRQAMAEILQANAEAIAKGRITSRPITGSRLNRIDP